jgi:hypothetical protein
MGGADASACGLAAPTKPASGIAAGSQYRNSCREIFLSCYGAGFASSARAPWRRRPGNRNRLSDEISFRKRLPYFLESSGTNICEAGKGVPESVYRELCTLRVDPDCVV